jgi:4-amino-4-deoxyprephenate dehydrogenase
MFANYLEEAGMEIYIIDRLPSNGKHPYEQCDITDPSTTAMAVIAKADMVMLALPELVAMEIVDHVTSLMMPNSLLVHTLSVQSPMFEKLHALERSLEAVGLNPMFAPSLDMAGRPIAVILQNGGQLSEQLLDMLRSKKVRLVQLNPVEHDIISASTQALTHATVLIFGIELSSLKIDIQKISSIAPPPHTTMLALLARITSGPPEVYWDIQTANPQSFAVRNALVDAIHELNDALEDQASFLQLLDEMKSVLGTKNDHYANICSHMFSGGFYDG